MFAPGCSKTSQSWENPTWPLTGTCSNSNTNTIQIETKTQIQIQRPGKAGKIPPNCPQASHRNLLQYKYKYKLNYKYDYKFKDQPKLGKSHLALLPSLSQELAPIQSGFRSRLKGIQIQSKYKITFWRQEIQVCHRNLLQFGLRSSVCKEALTPNIIHWNETY